MDFCPCSVRRRISGLGPCGAGCVVDACLGWRGWFLRAWSLALLNQAMSERLQAHPPTLCTVRVRQVARMITEPQGRMGSQRVHLPNPSDAEPMSAAEMVTVCTTSVKSLAINSSKVPSKPLRCFHERIHRRPPYGRYRE
jgi:hypothetical protein